MQQKEKPNQKHIDSQKNGNEFEKKKLSLTSQKVTEENFNDLTKLIFEPQSQPKLQRLL